jgi:hypothetical protein
MVRIGEDGEVCQSEIFPFRARGLTVQRERDMDEPLRGVLHDFEKHVDEFLFQGSGWVVERPVYLEAEVVQCKPLRGAGGCNLHVAQYKRKKGVMPTNIPEEEGEEAANHGMCFYLAVAAGIMGEQTADTQDLRIYIQNRMVLDERVKSGELSGEMALADISAFEEANRHLDIAVNVVYRDENDDVIPVYASPRIGAAFQIALLLFHTTLLKQDGSEQGVMHYAYVDHPGKIFAQRVSTSWGHLRTNHIFLCFNCFNSIRSWGAYQSHVGFCHNNKCQRINLPKKGDVLSFEESRKSDSRCFKAAFVLLFDFEALQVKPERQCSCPDDMVVARRWWEGLEEEERNNYLVEQSMLEGERADQWRGERIFNEAANRPGPARPRPVPTASRLPKMCSHKVLFYSLF